MASNVLNVQTKLSEPEGSPSTSSQSTELAVTELINQVGKRVYAARKEKRLSRRALSELSGVSPRYILQLEGGEGNISIGLLQRIAIAIEQPIESLVAPNNNQNEDVVRLIALFQNADANTQANVLNTLNPDQQQDKKSERICLIGLRGAGKSTLGSLLGKALELPFIELNQEIEKHSGMPVSEVIAMYGEEGYRKLEADTIQTIIETHERMVLAVAGGVVEEPDTFTQVLNRFHTIWLKANPTDHMERVRAQGDLRPMAGNPQAMEQLRQILIARESRYSQAEYFLDTSGKTIDACMLELCSLVESKNIVETS